MPPRLEAVIDAQKAKDAKAVATNLRMALKTTATSVARRGRRLPVRTKKEPRPSASSRPRPAPPRRSRPSTRGPLGLLPVAAQLVALERPRGVLAPDHLLGRPPLGLDDRPARWGGQAILDQAGRHLAEVDAVLGEEGQGGLRLLDAPTTARGRTRPWSRKASRVASGMVFTVSGPTSSST